MLNTVKKRIRLGTVFLFMLTLLSCGVGLYHLVRLNNDTTRILKNNYESLDYAHSMQRIIDALPAGSPFPAAFDSILTLQEKNVTEKGELSATGEIRSLFQSYQSDPAGENLVPALRKAISQILVVNMDAIEHKNQKATQTAERAFMVISLLAALVLIVGLTFTFNFPSILTSPLAALTEGLREISRKNYKHRIHLDRKDEFGEMAESFNLMAERLEYFENSNLNKLIFEKTRAEAVINSLKEASIGIDASNTILFANDQALQLLHLQAKDIVGKTVGEVSQRNELFRFLIEDRGTLPFKIVLDDRENYFTREIIDVNLGETSSKLIVLQNITTFKELDTAKTNFIATVSHELKTPLAASDFSLKLMEDARTGALTTEQQELVDGLKQNNQRMLKILSELLNMAQVEAGRIELHIQQVQPVSIAQLSLEATQTTAREKGISIHTSYDEQLPLVQADREKTSWVLNNFIQNAIRYSSDNTSIDLKIKRQGNYVEFSVADKGPGISAEYSSRIFNRFFKIPGSKEAGTGLGLSISKDFIQAQGGETGVHSQPGEGSTFYFTLPAVQ